MFLGSTVEAIPLTLGRLVLYMLTDFVTLGCAAILATAFCGGRCLQHAVFYGVIASWVHHFA